MSILKSTNTGRCSIKIDESYLLSKGWYYKNFPSGERDKHHIYKDDNHFLTLINLDLFAGEIIIITFHEETDDWIYNTIITSLANLDDIEQYWKDREVDFEKAEYEFLAKYPGSKSLNVMKKTQQNVEYEFSKYINKRIMDKLVHNK